MKSYILVASTAAALAAATSASAQQRRSDASDFSLSASTGVDYSVGDYGAADKTKILVVPLSLRATTGPLRLSATLPYLRIDSPGGVVLGPDGRPLPGIPAAAGVRKGLGDLSLGATYSLPSESLGGFAVDIGGRVKLPTSDKSKRLSTGKTDVAASIDVSRDLGSWSPFVTLGYRIPGDPAGVDLRSGPTASVGASIPAGKAVAILSYDYARASSRLAEDSHELFGALSSPVSDRFTLTGYGSAGLSQGSPDFGIGLLMTLKIG